MAAVDTEELAKFLEKLELQLARLERLENRERPKPTCFTYEEAAAELGVCSRTIREMVDSGQLRPSTIGKRRKISQEELLRARSPDAIRPQVQRAQRAKAWTPVDRSLPPKFKPKKP